MTESRQSPWLHRSVKAKCTTDTGNNKKNVNVGETISVSPRTQSHLVWFPVRFPSDTLFPRRHSALPHLPLLGPKCDDEVNILNLILVSQTSKYCIQILLDIATMIR